MGQMSISELQEQIAAMEAQSIAGHVALELMHEIRNPLEAVGYLTYLALQEADDSNQVRKYMCLAQEQLTSLGEIVGESLGAARPDQERTPVDLVAVAEAALRIHQRRITAKKVNLVCNLTSEVMAPVYTGQILRVLSNLIVNALDALPPHGTLQVRLRKSDGEVQLVIADNGHGIPAKHSEKIFLPYFTTKKERGNGLGLALSKKIIDRHNGRISMRSSVRPGKSGTLFKICLPA